MIIAMQRHDKYPAMKEISCAMNVYSSLLGRRQQANELPR
jgi:hypothetical protein